MDTPRGVRGVCRLPILRAGIAVLAGEGHRRDARVRQRAGVRLLGEQLRGELRVAVIRRPVQGSGAVGLCLVNVRFG